MVKKEGKSMTKSELEQVLIDNFINLQKVLTNLSIRFDDLSNNISKLLQLFEISAKSFAEKYSETNNEKSPEADKEFLKKLDSLLDQNKTIAKGIMLMEEKIRQRNIPPTPNPTQEPIGDPRFKEMIKSKPLPRY